MKFFLLTVAVLALLVASGEAEGVPSKPAECLQPKIEGLCDALFGRFYYNSEKGICEEFNYGGCGGNGNNFHTLEECQQKCM